MRVVSKKWPPQLIHKQGNRKVQWQFQTRKIRKRFLCNIGLLYYGKTSNQFAKRLANLIKLKFNVDINVYFTAMKMPRIILSSVILLLLCCLMSCINLLVRVMRITHTLV